MSTDTEICKHSAFMPTKVADALPEYQGGPGRHKCAVCAYLEGYKRGQQEMRDQISMMFANMLTKCANRAVALSMVGKGE